LKGVRIGELDAVSINCILGNASDKAGIEGYNQNLYLLMPATPEFTP
jgi:hypothetical protein